MRITDSATKSINGTAKVIGALNINNMLPVEDCLLTPINLKINPNDSEKTISYKDLMKNQLSYCQQNQDIIVKRANRFLDHGWIHPISVFFLIFNHEKHLKNIDPEMQQPIKPPNNALTIATVGSAV